MLRLRSMDWKSSLRTVLQNGVRAGHGGEKLEIEVLIPNATLWTDDILEGCATLLC